MSSTKQELSTSSPNLNSLLDQLIIEFSSQIILQVKLAIKEALETKSTESSVPISDKEGFLDRAQAAKFLKISFPSLLHYQKDGSLPYHKIGRKVLFKRSDLINATKIIFKKKGRSAISN